MPLRFPCPITSELTLEVLIHIFIVICALNYIFETVLSKTTSKLIEKELGGFINQATDIVYSKLENEGCYIKTPFAHVLNVAKRITDVDDEDSTDSHNNNMKAVNKLLLTAAFVIIVILIVVVKMVEGSLLLNGGRSGCYLDKMSLKKIGLNNLITLAIVILFEYKFITSVAAKYIPTNSEDVKTTIRNRLETCVLEKHKMNDKIQFPPINSAAESPFLRCISTMVGVLIILVCGTQIVKIERDMTSLPVTGNGLVSKGFSMGVVLPAISACGMVFCITAIFFTYAKNMEKKIFNRQAERIVDYITRLIMIGTDSIGGEAQDVVEKKILKSIIEIPELKASQTDEEAKKIEKNNKPLIGLSANICSTMAVVCVSILILGLFGFETSKGKKKFAKVAAYSFVLSASVAFLCEYTFLNDTIAKFDAVDPGKLVRESIDELQEKLMKDC